MSENLEASRLRAENAILRAESRLLAEKNVAEDEQRQVLERTLKSALKELEKLQTETRTLVPGACILSDIAGIAESVQELHNAVSCMVTERSQLRRKKNELEKQVERLKTENKVLLDECQNLRKELSINNGDAGDRSIGAAKPPIPTPRENKLKPATAVSSADYSSWMNFFSKGLLSRVYSAGELDTSDLMALCMVETEHSDGTEID